MKHVISFLAGVIVTAIICYFTFNKSEQKKQDNTQASLETSATSVADKKIIDTIYKSQRYVAMTSNNLYNAQKRGFKDIPVEKAYKLVKTYMDNNSPTAPAFIDFSFDEVFDYLDLVKTELGYTFGLGLRIYFGMYDSETADANHPIGSLSLILLATRSGIDYFSDGLKPIDYGNLCPPSTNCRDTVNAQQLIYSARRLAARKITNRSHKVK